MARISKKAMVETLTNMGTTIYGVNHMLKEDVERYYNARIKEEETMTTKTTTVVENTNEEETTMTTKTVSKTAAAIIAKIEALTPAYGDRLQTLSVADLKDLYNMLKERAPKKERKPSKLTAVRENVLEAFLNLLPSTPWTYTTRNKKPVLDLRINDGKKIMVIIRYSNRGVQVMSKVEFPGSEVHEKWSHPYAVMAKTAEDAIQTLTAIQTAIDQQEAEKKAKAEAEKKEEPKTEEAKAE